MGTHTKDTQTAQYDPGSMKAFQQATPAWLNPAMQFAQNPYGGQQFQFERQMGTQNAANQNQMGMSNLLRNQQMSGFGGGASSPFMQEMQANQMRAGTANTAMQGLFMPEQLAGGRQQNAMAMLQGYRPLQTGQTDVKSTGGLGTWLPQVAGMALGGLTGGAGAALGRLFRGGGSGSGGTSWANLMGGSGPSGWNSGFGNSGSFWGQGGMAGAAPGVGSLYGLGGPGMPGAAPGQGGLYSIGGPGPMDPGIVGSPGGPH